MISSLNVKSNFYEIILKDMKMFTTQKMARMDMDRDHHDDRRQPIAFSFEVNVDKSGKLESIETI